MINTLKCTSPNPGIPSDYLCLNFWKCDHQTFDRCLAKKHCPAGKPANVNQWNMNTNFIAVSRGVSCSDSEARRRRAARKHKPHRCSSITHPPCADGKRADPHSTSRFASGAKKPDWETSRQESNNSWSFPLAFLRMFNWKPDVWTSHQPTRSTNVTFPCVYPCPLSTCLNGSESNSGHLTPHSTSKPGSVNLQTFRGVGKAGLPDEQAQPHVWSTPTLNSFKTKIAPQIVQQMSWHTSEHPAHCLAGAHIVLVTEIVWPQLVRKILVQPSQVSTDNTRAYHQRVLPRVLIENITSNIAIKPRKGNRTKTIPSAAQTCTQLEMLVTKMDHGGTHKLRSTSVWLNTPSAQSEQKHNHLPVKDKMLQCLTL